MHVQYFYASTVLYPTLSSLGSTVLASIQYLFDFPVCDFEIYTDMLYRFNKCHQMCMHVDILLYTILIHDMPLYTL